jgi:hypothetical protein
MVLLFGLPVARHAMRLHRSLRLPSDCAPPRRRQSRRFRQTTSFDLLACRRKGAGVRRNILRRKID